MRAEEKLITILGRYVPANALEYCVRLWIGHPFHFKVARKRNSKQGDYFFNPADRSHTITVNGNLNPYSFLITYIHELAHMINCLQYGPRVTPHGAHWKKAFRSLMQPLLTTDVFPAALLPAIKKHMINPSAAAYSDPELSRALRTYDANGREGGCFLENIQRGGKFLFNKRIFTKIETRRTRALCRDESSGKKYFISLLAEVEKIH